VQVVQIDVVQRCFELRKRIQRGFLCSPVETILPVSDEIARVVDAGAKSPGLAGCGVGEAGLGEADFEVGVKGCGAMGGSSEFC
jgi:hypothetical protein